MSRELHLIKDFTSEHPGLVTALAVLYPVGLLGYAWWMFFGTSSFYWPGMRNFTFVLTGACIFSFLLYIVLLYYAKMRISVRIFLALLSLLTFCPFTAFGLFAGEEEVVSSTPFNERIYRATYQQSPRTGTTWIILKCARRGIRCDRMAYFDYGASLPAASSIDMVPGAGGEELQIFITSQLRYTAGPTDWIFVDASKDSNAAPPYYTLMIDSRNRLNYSLYSCEAEGPCQHLPFTFTISPQIDLATSRYSLEQDPSTGSLTVYGDLHDGARNVILTYDGEPACPANRCSVGP